jgi:hypothetical protein
MSDRRLAIDMSVTGTLAMMARIYDIGAQYARFGAEREWRGLPRTYEEYVAKLYGAARPDRFQWLNYGLLLSLIALVLVIAIGVRS